MAALCLRGISQRLSTACVGRGYCGSGERRGGKTNGFSHGGVCAGNNEPASGGSQLEDGWTISLVDQNGHLSAHPNMDSYSPLVDLSGYEPVKQMRTGQAGNGTFVRDAKSFFTR